MACAAIIVPIRIKICLSKSERVLHDIVLIDELNVQRCGVNPSDHG
jgi:hypothetical protein